MMQFASTQRRVPGARPDLSVIVVNRNTRDYLERCLRSLRAQCSAALPDEQLEIIVVDNASTDGSVDLVRARYPEAILIENGENRGYSAANNQGLGRARGRYALLLNSDTEVQQGALIAMLTYADEHPHVGILGPQLLNPDGSLQPSGGRFPRVWSTIAQLLGIHKLAGVSPYGTKRDYSRDAEVDEVSGAAMLLRRRVVDLLGGLDEGYSFGYEDIDVCLRARRSGWGIRYVPAARVLHIWGASRSAAPAATTIAALAGQHYYFRQHHGQGASGLIYAATLLAHSARLLVFVLLALRQADKWGRARDEGRILRALVRMTI